MTTKKLTSEMKKCNDKLKKRNFKSGEESELHLRLDTLRRLRTGLQRLETEFELLNKR